MVFAQRITLPLGRHQDAAQVGVPGEADAEHVINLALVPAGAGPDIGRRRCLHRAVFERHLDPHVTGRLKREQVVDQAEVMLRPLPAVPFIDGGDILEPGVTDPVAILEEPEQVGQVFPGGDQARHVDRRIVKLDPAFKTLENRFPGGVIALRKLNFRLRRCPERGRAGPEKVGMLRRAAPHRRVAVAGPAGIAALADAVFQHRHRCPFGAARKTQHLARRLFIVGDFFLQQQQALQEGLGARRATGDVDIDRQDLVDPLDDRVDIVHAAGIRAAAHRHDPFRVGHLLIDPEDRRAHFLERRSGNDHQVGFTRSRPQHLGPEAGQVETGSHTGHHLDKTAGETEEHRPKRILAPPVYGIVKPGQNDILRQFPAHRLTSGFDFTWRG